MQPYRSCNCRRCRRVPSGVKRHHKDAAHRAFRRESRLSILCGEYETPIVSTGYKA
jgi:hypothetical protein